MTSRKCDQKIGIERLFNIGCVGSILLAMSACGGGTSGGGGTVVTPPTPVPAPTPTPPPPTPPPPTINYDTAEYRQNWGHAATNAKTAYEQGATGDGVLVAVIDTGVATNSGQFPNIHPASRDVVNRTTPSLTDTDGHGTFIAGVIAAAKDNVGMHGIAFDSQLLVLRTDDDSPDCNNSCSSFDSDIAAAIDIAVAEGAKVINISMSGNATASSLQNALVRAAAANTLIVISAGNDGDAAPSNFALFGLDPRVAGNILIVGAADEAKEITDQSNRAGNGQSIYLLAPGINVTSVGLAGGLARGAGSSFSAPHVTGAAALLIEAFPNLSAIEVGQILLTTAEDLGLAGVDNIYGNGFLDINAAFQPIGTAALPTENGGIVPITGTGISLSPVFGDALTGSSLNNIMFVDDFDRSFYADLSSNISSNPMATNRLRNAIDQRNHQHTSQLSFSNNSSLSISYDKKRFSTAPNIANLDEGQYGKIGQLRLSYNYNINDAYRLTGAFGYALSDVFLKSSGFKEAQSLLLTADASLEIANYPDQQQFAFAAELNLGSDLSLNVGIAQNVSGKPYHTYIQQTFKDARAFTAAIQIQKNFSFVSLTSGLSLIDENYSIFGSRYAGAFDYEPSTRTINASISGETELDENLYLTANISLANSNIKGSRGTFINKISNLKALSFNASIIRRNLATSGDALGFSVSQPLRIEDGVASLTLPTGRDYVADRYLFTTTDISLAPTAREIDLEIGYRFSFNQNIEISSNLIMQLNPGHSASTSSAFLGLLNIKKRF